MLRIGPLTCTMNVTLTVVLTSKDILTSLFFWRTLMIFPLVTIKLCWLFFTNIGSSNLVNSIYIIDGIGFKDKIMYFWYFIFRNFKQSRNSAKKTTKTFNVCWKLITASVSRALSNPNYKYLIHVGTKLRKGWDGIEE